MAGRRGWDGRPPTSDEDAETRIVSMAVKLMADKGSGISIAEVANALGVIRQTVYRYFPNAESLMAAAAVTTVGAFFERLVMAVAGITDPADAMTEGVLFTLEEITRTPHLGIVLSEDNRGSHAPAMASEQAIELGMQVITRFDVEWAIHGFDEPMLRELIEHTLRTILSFFMAPNPAGRSRDELRGYLRRWFGGAILAQVDTPDGPVANTLLHRRIQRSAAP
jgi:AcrR family transcriptional regulator